MGALLSFLGGGAFRAIWGELSATWSKRQDHKYEIERMKLQGTLDAEQHARNLAAQKQQAELGYKTINVQAEADVSRIGVQAWAEAVANLQKPTGVKWIDGWNGAIRPSFATVAILLWLWSEFQHMAANAWVVTAFSLDLICVVAGFYFASRELSKRGK